MTDGKAQAEPTMEEILASIRRIISEDEQGGEKAPAQTPNGAAAATPAPEAPPAPAEDVLELTEVVNADGSVSSLKDEQGVEADAMLEPEPFPEPSFEPEPEPETRAFARPPREAPPPPPRDFFGDAPADDSGLLSQQAATSATASFAGLLGSVSGSRGVHLGDGAKTLEDIVKELLRPMLKDWLDRNLPGMVERLVSREISKIAGRAEQD